MKMGQLLEHQEILFDSVSNAMEEALILIDSSLLVTYMNESAKRLLRISGEAYVGRHFFDDLSVWVTYGDRDHTKVHEVLRSEKPQKGLIRNTTDGRQLSINIVPLHVGKSIVGVMITGEDISHVSAMQQELDMAFALTLPNSKVEYRLKSIPEYQDVYDPASKLISITGVIGDGGYRHLVNCLKLFSLLVAKDVTRLIGIDKDDLVHVLVYHDLGKSQPVLQIGDVVDPKIAFEDGKLHAERSADMAKYHYSQKDEIVQIIRYHHHSEKDLPESFPRHLLPMFRLFQIIDGTSAAITRGGVDVFFDVRDCVVEIKEVNHRPQYNGTRYVDLYTGQHQWIPAESQQS